MSNERKFTKSQRIQVLLDALSRWGRLNKSQISEHVGQVTEEDFSTEAFNRAILRDLSDLVRDHKIQVEYFSRDGGLIEDYDPDIHKNVFCEWFLAGSEGQITGSGSLKSQNSYFHAPKLLKNDLSILSGNNQADPRHRHIYFQIGSSFLCLKASFEALPFSVVIGRIHGAVQQSEIDSIKKSFGTRACILKVPFPKLSSFKDDKKPGHLLLHFENESTISLTDFNSSNGTVVYKLKVTEADKIRSSGSMMNDFTLTNTWKDIDLNFVNPMKIEGKLSYEAPILVEMGDEFKLLIV